MLRKEAPSYLYLPFSLSSSTDGAERETMRERFRGAREKADAFAGKVETFVATAVWNRRKLRIIFRVNLELR